MNVLDCWFEIRTSVMVGGTCVAPLELRNLFGAVPGVPALEEQRFHPGYPGPSLWDFMNRCVPAKLLSIVGKVRAIESAARSESEGAARTVPGVMIIGGVEESSD
jgi:hypothetical protein